MNTLLLTGSDLRRLLTPAACMQAVEDAFRRLGDGRAPVPVTAAVPVPGGGFHLKAATLEYGRRRYFAAKVNGNFPRNRYRTLPTIQGILLLCDAEDGSVLALMDSMELTALRTAAATAVAARHLARMDSSVLGLIGCGMQASYQLEAVAAALPIRRAVVHDTDPERAADFAVRMTRELGMEVHVRDSPGEVGRCADVIVTCTTGGEYVLDSGDVAPGAFVAGVGADDESKRELTPSLLAAARVVTDLTEQCAHIGDLHHAIQSGMLRRDSVHAELAAVVAGLAPGRTSDEEIFVFDSTGIAIQDVAAAVAVYGAADPSAEMYLDFGR